MSVPWILTLDFECPLDLQSMIADTGKREILYDLELTYDRLRKDNPNSEAAPMIHRAQSNLVRRWSEV